MCGIAGILAADSQSIPSGLTDRVLAELAHRGPDDRGILFLDDTLSPRDAHEGPSFRAALLHRRLSIIDLSANGHQPMSVGNGRCWITYNGEIYNYRELRSELRGKGVEFRTDSDTEVILHAYRFWGCEAVARLRGMFGFCIVDLDTRKFMLARDHFGIKPLYYSAVGKSLGFASEPSALLKMMNLKPRLRTDTAIQYLALGIDEDGTHSFFQDVTKLPAGYCAIGDLDAPTNMQPKRYWAVSELPECDSAIGTPERVRKNFLESVELHLRADVPVGILLSGGIDSSSVACAARIVAPRQELHSFTFSADDAAVNETAYANIVNQHIGAVAHLCEISIGSFSERAERTVAMLGEPVRGMACVAASVVFEQVKAHGLKVVLSGQGSDEMLAGYAPYEALALLDCLRQGRIGAATARIQDLRRQGKLRLVMSLLGKESLGTVLPGFVAKLLANKLKNVLGAPAMRRAEVALSEYCGTREIALRHRLGQDLAGNQLLGILRAEDRLAMAFSIESRVPFLYPEFVRSVQAADSSQLVDDSGTTKSIFREAMAGIVPDAILRRRDKFGYTGPENEWAKAISGMLLQELDHMIDRNPGFLRRDALLEWRREGVPKVRNNRLLWSLYNFFAWIRVFDVDVSQEAIA